MKTSFVTALLCAALSEAQSFKIGQTVKTTTGDVTGKPSTWKPEVSEYLGIPFAEPPVGKLRWAAPVAIKAAGKAVNATKYGNSCINVARNTGTTALTGTLPNATATVPQKEDCLYINVWTKPQTGEKKKAVMVWIYGGAFVTGAGSIKGYDGSLLADQYDVVVVNMNYRLATFGYANLPFMKDQNVGLLDQRLAVEWVRDNIEAFGGDVSRITLFGQSAGGASVDYYTFAYTKDPIVHALIPQSGTTSLMPGNPTNIARNWYSASEKLGCGGVSAGEKTLDCMRSKSTSEIQGAFGAASGFIPSPDGKIVFSDYSARTAAGNFIQKPTLIGNTENESATFIRGNNTSPAARIAFDSIFRCPASSVAKARTERKIPTWRYSYAGDFPNQKISADMGTGPFHGSEIGLIYGTSSTTRKTADTTEQASLAKKFQVAWTTFAKDPVNGLDQLKWPRYNASAPTIVVLGGKNKGDITYQTSAKYDAACGAAGKRNSLA